LMLINRLFLEWHPRAASSNQRHFFRAMPPVNSVTGTSLPLDASFDFAAWGKNPPKLAIPDDMSVQERKAESANNACRATRSGSRQNHCIQALPRRSLPSCTAMRHAEPRRRDRVCRDDVGRPMPSYIAMSRGGVGRPCRSCPTCTCTFCKMSAQHFSSLPVL
jgi:hypothetical protein